MTSTPPLTPSILLQGYASGIFPMADGRESTDIYWVNPKRRGILPLDQLHISRSLKRRILRQADTITLNHDFTGVVAGCAAREETWINDEIFDLYTRLYKSGFAHSLEVWQNDTLIGGIYGVALGGAFFGESMFSNARDGSKIALAYLVTRLVQTGFELLDTQFITPHLATMGGTEISRRAYHAKLRSALAIKADILSPGPMPTAQDVVQRNTQTS